MRKFQGYTRTVCNCAMCAVNCMFIPGYLLPEDLYNIYDVYKNQYKNIYQFAEDFLLASPGAIVIKDGQFTRIRTLVPARTNQRNHCIFLSSTNRCNIHNISPFGCAFFDSHQDPAVSNYISKEGLKLLYMENENINNSLYYKVWSYLHDKLLVASPPEKSRKEMMEHLQNNTIKYANFI